MRFRQLAAVAVLTLAAIVAPSSADAQAIEKNQWYTFGFGGVGTSAVGGATFVLGVNSIAAPAPGVGWTFSSATPFTFQLVDGFQAGDQFSLFTEDILLGTSSLVAADRTITCGNDELTCLADDRISRLEVDGLSGAFSFNIRVETSPYGGGAGFFRITDAASVPEPTTFALMGLGLMGLGGVVRRRRSA